MEHLIKEIYLQIGIVIKFYSYIIEFIKDLYGLQQFRKFVQIEDIDKELSLNATRDIIKRKLKKKPDFEVDEDTDSFEKDALKKALEYSKFLNLPTISLDRGIEIPSLNNWPGTKSKDVFLGYSEETKDFINSNRKSN